MIPWQELQYEGDVSLLVVEARIRAHLVKTLKRLKRA